MPKHKRGHHRTKRRTEPRASCMLRGKRATAEQKKKWKELRKRGRSLIKRYAHPEPLENKIPL